MPKVARIAESFTPEERQELLSICNDFSFIDALETVRAEYACAVNNSESLTVPESERRHTAGIEWAMRSPALRRRPNETETRAKLEAIAKQAAALHEALANLDPIAKVALERAGLFPLIEREEGCAGLDGGLLVRMMDGTGYLAQSAHMAARSDLSKYCYSGDWRSAFSNKAAREVSTILERYGIERSRYAPNRDYDEGKSSKGGALWRALRIVLCKPPDREFRELFESR